MMSCQYLDSLITGHTFGSMISKLNKLKLQKELEIIKSFVLDTQHDNNKTKDANIIILARAGN